MWKTAESNIREFSPHFLFVLFQTNLGFQADITHKILITLKKMKKIILIVLLLVGWINASAQDVIITKEGQQIPAKVIEIGEDKVKYNRWDNLDGPTYYISLSKITIIKYQNGTQDYFDDFEAPKNQIAESITKVGDDVSSNIDKTGSKLTSQVGKVAKQQDLYTRARTLRACGYTFGGLCFVGCIVWAVCSPQFQEGKTPWAPIIVGSLGSTAIFASFAVPANNLENEADLMSCQVLGQYEFNEHFAMNVQGFHYQPKATRSYGVGLEIRF